MSVKNVERDITAGRDGKEGDILFCQSIFLFFRYPPLWEYFPFFFLFSRFFFSQWNFSNALGHRGRWRCLLSAAIASRPVGGISFSFLESFFFLFFSKFMIFFSPVDGGREREFPRNGSCVFYRVLPGSTPFSRCCCCFFDNLEIAAARRLMAKKTPNSVKVVR